MLGVGLGYGTQLLLIRWAGTTAYGTYVYALTWVNVLAMLAGVGFPSAASRFIPEYLAGGHDASLRSFLAGGLQVTALASSALALLGLMATVLLHHTTVSEYIPALRIGFGLLPLFALFQWQTNVFRAFGQIAVAYIPPLLLRPALTIGGVLVLVQLGWDVTGSTLLVVVAAAVLGLLLVRAGGWHHGALSVAFRRVPVLLYRTWLDVALPLLLHAGFWLLLSQSDLLVLGFFATSEEVGMYSIVSRLASAVSFALTSLTSVAAPLYAGLFVRGERAELQRLVVSAAHWAFWPGFVAAGALAAFGPVLLHFFSPAYAGTYPELMILTLSNLVNVAAGTVGCLLSVTGLQRQLARVIGWSSGLNVVLNLALVPWLGLLGAALATLTATVLWNAWLYAIAARRLRLHTSILAPLLRRPDSP